MDNFQPIFNGLSEQFGAFMDYFKVNLKQLRTKSFVQIHGQFQVNLDSSRTRNRVSSKLFLSLEGEIPGYRQDPGNIKSTATYNS